MKGKWITVSRVLLGLVFTAAGLNGYVVLFGWESLLPTSPAAMEFLGSGYLLALVKTVELIGGLLLLANRYVPLGLAMLAPVAVNILAFHLFADPGMLANGVIVAVLGAHLLWAYRDSFKSLLVK